ncbi:c-type cytochrome [Falsiroseomonas sp. HW251]|uniref:c-type cytochrome n=1 Tax=Falsiroseomonas sp. HW251 TaxID=3390998 RepID=UPI003D3109FD
MRRVIACALLLAAPAAAQDGRLVFERSCASCHAVASDAPPMAGPNLQGVLGRRVAGDAGFDYSPVLREAGQAGDTWDTARLARFLEDPEEMYSGLWMGGNGLRSEAERRAVVEWLTTNGGAR